MDPTRREFAAGMGAALAAPAPAFEPAYLRLARTGELDAKMWENVAEVMDQLKEIPEVLEASTVYGESDIIAKVQVGSQEELDSLVMDKLHAIPAVESTRTFIVIGRLHWSRERPD